MDTTMPFGKHKGTSLSDIPGDYLQWVSGEIQVREPLKSAVERELSRRSTSSETAHFPQLRILASDMPAPFPSRCDSVIRLDLPFDRNVIAVLRESLRAHRAMAVDPSRRIDNAGGFRPDSKTWWVENAAWRSVRTDLEINGYIVST